MPIHQSIKEGLSNQLFTGATSGLDLDNGTERSDLSVCLCVTKSNILKGIRRILRRID